MGFRNLKFIRQFNFGKTGKTPVIDLGTIDHIKKGKIKVVGDIDHFYEDGVVLKDGEKIELEAIILATGYRAKLQDFIPELNHSWMTTNYQNKPKERNNLKGSILWDTITIS